MRIVTAPVLTLLFLPSPSAGQNSTFALSGVGSQRCSELTHNFDILPPSHKDTYTYMATSWVQGFVSGLNYQGIVLKQPSFADMKGVKFENFGTTLLARCRTSPDKSTFEIALEFYDLLPREPVPPR